MQKSRAENYLERAEELRVLAADMKHDEPREIMERVAADYERMADRELLRAR